MFDNSLNGNHSQFGNILEHNARTIIIPPPSVVDRKPITGSKC